MTFLAQNASWRCFWVCAIAFVAALGCTRPVAAQSLTNADVVKMVQAKLGDGVIINSIKNSSCKFDTSPDALIKLKQAGVSDRVLEAMTEARKAGSGAVAASSSNSDTAIPAPESYGTYAVADGKLLGIDVQSSTMRPQRVSVRVWANPVTSSITSPEIHEQQIPILPAGVNFVQFGHENHIDMNKMWMSPFIRRASGAFGRVDMTNAWPAQEGGPTLKAISLLEKPMAGHQDVSIFSPAEVPPPGVYWIYTVAGYFVFAVGQPNEQAHCYDWFGVSPTPCDAPASTPENSAPNPSEPSRAVPAPADSASAQAAELPSAWDSTLKTGGTVTFEAWHYAGAHYEKGSFQMSKTAVSFIGPNGATLFSASPAQLSSVEAHHPLFGGESWSFGMKVSGHKLWFAFVPLGVDCKTPSGCNSPGGYSQEGVVANYVVQAIQKLAAGGSQ